MAAQFRLLGEVEVLVDGQPVDIGHAMQRSVLAVLLVEANRLLSTGQLVERVWGDESQPRARNTLYGYVHRLRGALAGAADLQRKHGGYVLEVDPATVDLHRFRALVSEARSSADDRGLSLLTEALGLWRGEAFGGAESSWLSTMRSKLKLDHLDARLAYHDLALRDRRHAELLADLSALAEAHPMDERIAGQLMVALHRSGRSAAAFDHYHQLRNRFVEELGVGPGAELRQVYQQMLADDQEHATPPVVGEAVPAPPEPTATPAPAPEPAAAPLPESTDVPQPPRAKSRRGALVPIVALVVLIAAMIAGARLLLGGGADDGKETTASVPRAAAPVTSAAPASGGYDFRLAHSSLCLEERREDGSGRVFQGACDGGIPSRALQSVRAGVYRVTTSHPDFGAGCMGIPQASMEPAEPVVDDFCDRGSAEEFRLERITSPTNGYLIRAVHSDLCLGVLNGSKEEWAPVFQLPCDSTARGQVFELIPKP